MALRRRAMLVSGHRAVIAALAFLGRKEEAMAAALHLRQFVPDARADADYRRLYRNQGFAEQPIRAYREAGLPQ